MSTGENALISYEALERMSSTHISEEEKGRGVHWVSLPHEEIPIRTHSDPNHPGALSPITVMDVFQETMR